jgi:chemotaxis protein CheX
MGAPLPDRSAPVADGSEPGPSIKDGIAIIEESIMSVDVSSAKSITMQELESCLERALKEITTTMFNCESTIIPLNQVDIIPPGLSAVVGFGGKICGFVALHLSPSSACTLASDLLGMHFAEMDDIVADAMGEMVNMLAGGLKKYASKNEDLFKISVPSIVYGLDYATHSPKNAEHLTMGVETGSCTFSVQLVYALR